MASLVTPTCARKLTCRLYSIRLRQTPICLCAWTPAHRLIGRGSLRNTSCITWAPFRSSPSLSCRLSHTNLQSLMNRKSSIEGSRDKHPRKARGAAASRIDVGGTHERVTPAASRIQVQQNKTSPPIPMTNFKFLINRPQAIVIDLLGVLVCKSFMTSSKEFRDFFQHNVLEYLNDNWKQKQLKIMINFFRCSQANVPDEYKLADREEPKEEQIKQAKRHVVWKLRNDPTNSALSLFMLGITEWGYRTKTLQTMIYDEVPSILRQWKEQLKIPVYVGVGSADFLVMVLTNTNYGNILPFFNGHMNIMDFDGTRANKDFKKLVAILRLSPDKILYLTRFRVDCKRAMENGLQSLLMLRPDFDSHGLINRLLKHRGAATSQDGSKLTRAAFTDDVNSPPGKMLADVKNPEMRRQLETNISSLSLIDDHDDADRYNAQSSQIVEGDLAKYSVVLSLSEIAFK